MPWYIWAVISFLLVAGLLLWCALACGSRDDDHFYRDYFRNVGLVLFFAVIISMAACAVTSIFHP